LKKVFLIVLAMIICAALFGCSDDDKSIIIGTKDFTEQHILGDILKLYIEDNTNIEAALVTDLATELIFAAIRTGVIDLYVDYTGTIYSFATVRSESGTPADIFRIVSNTVDERYDLYMFDPLGFNNSYQLAVRRELAEEYGLKTLSDLATVSENFVFGGGAEIVRRNDGLPNLQILYDMNFKDVRILDGIDRYLAISQDEIQVSEVFSTDGHLVTYDLVVLVDDKHFFPPYEGVVIIRKDTMEKFPELHRLLETLSGTMTDETMRELNYRVDVLGNTPQMAADHFLRNKNLIS
jgi:osmoprotectant transport system permease protein